MKNLFLLVALFLVVSSVQARADEFNTRLLLHGHKTVAESNWGMAGWVIAPNVSSSPNTWLTIAGPCYSGIGWNLEVMGGLVTIAGDSKELVDVRLELTPSLLGVSFYTWHNFQWINTGDRGTSYWYGQVDWVVPLSLGLLGIETENIVSESARDYSVGPHIVLPFGDHLVLVAAPQFHFVDGFTEFQFWTRAVINL